MNKTNDNKGQYRTVSANNNITDLSSTDTFRFVDKDGHIHVSYLSIGRIKHIHSNFI
ncbi:unnamed protein product, partial [Rotaria magnacalcarata]